MQAMVALDNGDRLHCLLEDLTLEPHFVCRRMLGLDSSCTQGCSAMVMWFWEPLVYRFTAFFHSPFREYSP